MDTRKRLFAYVVKYKSRLIFAGLCSLILAGCNLIFVDLVGIFTSTSTGQSISKDSLIVSYADKFGLFRNGNIEFTLICIVAVLMVIVYIPKAFFAYLGGYVVASATNRVGNDVRRDVYSHLQTLSLRFFHRSRVGDLMSRMSSDVSIIQQSSQVVMQAIDGPIMIIAGLSKMIFISWKLSMLTIFFVPFMGIAIDRITKKIRSLTTATQATLADVSTTIEESVRGVRIIKSFGMEDYEIGRFNRVNDRSLGAALKAAKRNSMILPAIELMGGIATALLVYIGGWLIVSKQITFPDLSKFILLALMVASSAKQFGRLNVLYQQIIAAGQRVFELLDTTSDLPEDPEAVVLDEVQGKVEFDKVTFEYNENEIVLSELSFIMNPGEAVAIVGSSGAGKSTIADLIPRFYDVTGGKILVDNIDIRNINTVSLRKHIAMVPQETILFSGTIAENIAYGKPDAPMEEIIEVAKAANAHVFIDVLPNGYHTMLGESGVGLSGGQRQRISIARALLKNPKILILDEATSSLDAASEEIVQDALDKLMKGRSTLIIAHRLSTVRNADKILVMDKGRIIESGSFDDLVCKGGLFAQLYASQHRTGDTDGRSA